MTDIAKLAVAAFGLIFILIAVFMRQRLSDKQVVYAKLDKLGIEFRLNGFGLVGLLGAVLSVAPVALMYLDDQKTKTITRLEDQQRANKVLETKIAELLDALREYELRVGLVFPDKDAPDIMNMDWPPQAFIQRPGERKARPYDFVTFERGEGGVIATFKKLKPGDLVYVEATESTKTNDKKGPQKGEPKNLWRSVDVTGPSSQQLVLKRVKP
jgi:hypothetical protein